MKGVRAEYYFGTITDVPDSSESFVVKASIPGVMENLTCHPLRCGSDEPKIGDLVIIRDLDPEYHSYFVYEKLNENNFTGMRCKGKMIDFTDESLRIGIFDEGDFSDSDRPSNTSWIELDEDGNLDTVTEDNIYTECGGSMTTIVKEDQRISVEQNACIDIAGKATINIKNGEDVYINGKVNLIINGDYSLKVTGTLDIDATNIKIGGKTLKINTPPGSPGPFNNLCKCMKTPLLDHGTDSILLNRD